MTNTLNISDIFAWLFGVSIFSLGLANLLLVHPVPGIAYMLLSLVFIPPTNILLKRRAGFSIPVIIKIILGLVIIWFTLGVSDLGDMIDKL